MANAGHFEGIISDLGDVVLVVIEGEVDMYTASELDTLLDQAREQAGDRLVALGCEGLTFMDSQGLGVLVKAHKAATSAGGALELRSVPMSILRTMEIAGITEVVRVRRD